MMFEFFRLLVDDVNRKKAKAQQAFRVRRRQLSLARLDIRPDVVPDFSTCGFYSNENVKSRFSITKSEEMPLYKTRQAHRFLF
jgi:hypothetical protein